MDEKRGNEVWMTTAIDLKSPLEYFFWASLSYESLSYEPLSYEEEGFIRADAEYARRSWHGYPQVACSFAIKIFVFSSPIIDW